MAEQQIVRLRGVARVQGFVYPAVMIEQIVPRHRTSGDAPPPFDANSSRPRCWIPRQVLHRLRLRVDEPQLQCEGDGMDEVPDFTVMSPKERLRFWAMISAKQARARAEFAVSARSTHPASCSCCSSEGSAVATPRISARRPGCAQPARGAA